VPEEITAAQAARILQSAKPSGPAGRARRRALWGHSPPGRPDPRVEEEAGHRGQGIGHQPDRHLRRRPGHRRHRDGDVARFSFTASGSLITGAVGGPGRGRPAS